MKRVTVTELRRRLVQILGLVKEGETVEVVDNSVPIARIQRIGYDASTADKELDRLVREGVVTRASRKPDKAFLKQPPIPCSVDLAGMLIKGRGDR